MSMPPKKDTCLTLIQTPQIQVEKKDPSHGTLLKASLQGIEFRRCYSVHLAQACWGQASRQQDTGGTCAVSFVTTVCTAPITIENSTRLQGMGGGEGGLAYVSFPCT